MSPRLEMLAMALCDQLADVEQTLRNFGVTDWKVALVAGKPGHAKQSMVFTNFAGPDEVCAMVRGAETGEVREPGQ